MFPFLPRRLFALGSAAVLMAVASGCASKERGPVSPPVSVEKQREIFERLKNDDPRAPYVVAVPPGAPEFPENPANPLTRAGVQLGRWLFYDPIISGDNTMSCSSCHVQALAFTDGKKFSPGIRGENVGKNTMELVNLAWSRRLFWDGRAPTLEAQAVQPIQDLRELDQPMAGLIAELKSHPVYPKMFELAFGDPDVTEERIGRAIGQFVSSIVSFEAGLDEIERVDIGLKKETEIDPHLRPLLLTKAPRDTMNALSLCASCHRGIDRNGNAFGLYGGYRMSSNGLDRKPEPGYAAVTKDPRDFGHFKAPTLRNIALTAPYMHDGRFATLEEVVDHYDHGVQDFPGLGSQLREKDGTVKRLKLSDETKKDVIRYLNLMTDRSLLTNEKYSNPFH
ncbi:MAG TPA: cytochrome c peroxidase [bacterium]|nr:cytochrome c peroxidase [bacterium]